MDKYAFVVSVTLAGPVFRSAPQQHSYADLESAMEAASKFANKQMVRSVRVSVIIWDSSKNN